MVGSLKRAREVLGQLAITDGLTKIHNHRFFQDQLAREVKRSERAGEPLALVLVDIDDFKTLNDRHGRRRRILLDFDPAVRRSRLLDGATLISQRGLPE